MGLAVAPGRYFGAFGLRYFIFSPNGLVSARVIANKATPGAFYDFEAMSGEMSVNGSFHDA